MTTPCSHESRSAERGFPETNDCLPPGGEVKRNASPTPSTPRLCSSAENSSRLPSLIGGSQARMVEPLTAEDSHPRAGDCQHTASTPAIPPNIPPVSGFILSY
ncbi:hypothetical protein AB1Y20_001902 [Prymnesium parvum]|uniref:Uncharacterized protein n=1 Tax=Prymnesium parvum TaxID=97485 RepID=A0AB34J925_PRYPA